MVIFPLNFIVSCYTVGFSRSAQIILFRSKIVPFFATCFLDNHFNQYHNSIISWEILILLLGVRVLFRTYLLVLRFLVTYSEYNSCLSLTLHSHICMWCLLMPIRKIICLVDLDGLRIRVIVTSGNLFSFQLGWLNDVVFALRLQCHACLYEYHCYEMQLSCQDRCTL